jgi:hypothetical protein
LAVTWGRPAGVGSGRADDAAHREQQHERKWNLREEDRLPAEKLRENPTGGAPERGAEHTGGHPDAKRALVAALDLREEIERGRNDQRRADRLDAARTDERRTRREPAQATRPRTATPTTNAARPSP